MATESVFKFVSLRAPVTQGDAALARDTIPAPAGAVEPLLLSIEEIDSDSPHLERLRRGADRFVGGGRYFLHRLGDRRGAWLQEVETLVADLEVDGPTFRERADALLSQVTTPNDINSDGWRTPALQQQAWSSYAASLFASGDRGRETRALLGVIRLSYGYVRAGEAGFDARTLRLASRRAALPASLFEPGTASPAGEGRLKAGESPGRPNVAARAPAGQTPEQAPDLAHTLSVLRVAMRARRARLIAVTNTFMRDAEARTPAAMSLASGGSANVRGATAAKASGSDAKAGIPLAPSPPRESNAPLHRLSDADVTDDRARRTLAEFGLDLNESASVLIERVEALLGQKVIETHQAQRRTSVAWERGAFVQIRRTGTTEQNGA